MVKVVYKGKKHVVLKVKEGLFVQVAPEFVLVESSDKPKIRSDYTGVKYETFVTIPKKKLKKVI